MKENVHVILDEDETYKSISDKILQKSDIKNYKRYIDNLFIEKFFESKMTYKKDDCECKVEEDDNIKIFIDKTCFIPLV